MFYMDLLASTVELEEIVEMILVFTQGNAQMGYGDIPCQKV